MTHPARGPVPIFFAHYGDDGIRGSERVLLDILAHLDRARYLPLLWCNRDVMADAARSLDVETRVTPMPILGGWSAPRFELGEHMRLRREARDFIQRRGIRVVHANSGAPNQWLVPATRGLHVGYLTHLHAHYVLRDRCTLLLHQAYAIAGCSRGVLEPFEADGVDGERLHVVPNGVDVARILRGDASSLRAELGIPQSRTVVTAAGALIPLKGFDVLIRAMGMLKARGEEIALLLIGSGPEEAVLRQLASDCDVADDVHFLGARADLGAIFRDATDVVVVPSRQEAFGLTVAEAAMFGVPAVASDVPGLRETVCAGHVGGLLVWPGAAGELADAISELSRKPAMRRWMGEEARAHAIRNFTVETMVLRMDALYASLVESHLQQRSGLPRSVRWHPWRKLGRQWVQNRLRRAERA